MKVSLYNTTIVNRIYVSCLFQDDSNVETIPITSRMKCMQYNVGNHSGSQTFFLYLIAQSLYDYT